MNPGNMNSRFIKIWDNEIGKHLAAGDINIDVKRYFLTFYEFINIEMDIQAIFRSQLEKQKLIAPSLN